MEVIRAIDAGAIAGNLRVRAEEHRKKAAYLDKCAAWYTQSAANALGAGSGPASQGCQRDAGPLPQLGQTRAGLGSLRTDGNEG